MSLWSLYPIFLPYIINPTMISHSVNLAFTTGKIIRALLPQPKEYILLSEKEVKTEEGEDIVILSKIDFKC